MDWFKANKLTLNLEKTVCVLFSNKSKNKKLTLNIGTYKLQNSEIVKFLGVWIDDKLAWTKHMSTLMMKLKQNMHLLKLSNKFLTKDTKKLIYYAHIFSHLTYGILIWGNMINQGTINKIDYLSPNRTTSHFWCFFVSNWFLVDGIPLETSKVDHGKVNYRFSVTQELQTKTWPNYAGSKQGKKRTRAILEKM